MYIYAGGIRLTWLKRALEPGNESVRRLLRYTEVPQELFLFLTQKLIQEEKKKGYTVLCTQ